MATPTNTPVVKQVQDSAGALHDIAALYLTDGSNYYTPEDLLSAGVDYVIAQSLPTAGATYKGKIYLIPDSSTVESGAYIEYICVNTSGDTWSWEPIGTTKVSVSVSDVSTAKDTVTVQYDKVTGVTTSLQPAVTVNGSNFSFSGTTATITVSGTAASHTHSIGEGTKGYFTTETNVPKTFSTTSVVASLQTTTLTPVGGTANVVTGYESPSSTEVITGVSGTTTRYKTQSITPTNGTETVATAGTDQIVATEGITGYASPEKAGLATTSITYNTDAIKAYSNPTKAGMATTSIYPAANVTAVTTVTSTTATLASRVGSNVMNSATVSSDGVLSFASTVISGNVVSAVSSSGQSVRDTSTTVATGGTTTGTQFLTGLGTATAATKATTTVATGSTATGTMFLTGLGTATAAGTVSITPVGGTVSVAKAGSAVTVITSGTTTTGGVALITAVSASGTTNAITALGTASTTSVATAGTDVTVATGAKNTANAYTGIASSVTLVKGLTTTSNSNGTVITGLPTETGSADAAVTASGDFKPAGTIGGTQDIAAHNHTAYVTVAATSATVNVTGHTHVVTLSGGSVNNA